MPTQKRGRGRPTKLTPEIQAEICKYIRIGAYIETAGAACGVSKRTIHDWLKKGNRRGPRSKSFVDFLRAVQEAAAHAEMRDLGVISETAIGYEVKTVTEKSTPIEGGQLVIERTTKIERVRDWRAAAWKLERRAPKKWGRHILEHTGPGGAPLPTAAGGATVIFRIPDDQRNPHLEQNFEDPNRGPAEEAGPVPDPETGA